MANPASHSGPRHPLPRPHPARKRLHKTILALFLPSRRSTATQHRWHPTCPIVSLYTSPGHLFPIPSPRTTTSFGEPLRLYRVPVPGRHIPSQPRPRRRRRLRQGRSGMSLNRAWSSIPPARPRCLFDTSLGCHAVNMTFPPLWLSLWTIIPHCQPAILCTSWDS